MVIRVPAENGLDVVRENFRAVWYKLCDDNLQFLLSRVHNLPSKLFSRDTWGPVKGDLQSFCHDPT